MHVHVCVLTRARVYVRVHICMCGACACVCAYVCVHIFCTCGLYVHVCICVYVRVYMYACDMNIRVYTHASITADGTCTSEHPSAHLTQNKTTFIPPTPVTNSLKWIGAMNVSCPYFYYLVPLNSYPLSTPCGQWYSHPRGGSCLSPNPSSPRTLGSDCTWRRENAVMGSGGGDGGDGGASSNTRIPTHTCTHTFSLTHSLSLTHTHTHTRSLTHSHPAPP